MINLTLNRLSLWFLALALLGHRTCLDAFGQLNEKEEVTSPTRIDWTFPMAPRSLAQIPDDWIPNYQSEQQTYLLYVPESHDPKSSSGMILFISPMDRPMSVSDWRKVCDESNFILAIPNGAGNECHPPIRLRITLDVLDDVRRKYQIDADRTYIAGFSGGGRLAIRVAFSLPEYFGGVIPIGSTGELRNELWLRERITHRLGVANLIGAEDFNFVEITKFRGPLLDATEIRHKTWIIDDLAHEIPKAPVLTEAVKWLDETVAVRQAFAAKYPASRISGSQAPSRRERADQLFQEAKLRRRNKATRFSGDMLMKGVANRWPDLEVGKQAARLINADKSWRDEEDNFMHDYLVARARGLDAYATQETHERYADQKKVRLEAAILSWSSIVKAGKSELAIKEATERLIELEVMLEDLIEMESDQ